MKENIKLVVITFAIGLIAASTAAYYLHQNRKELWNEYAQNTFAKVLNEDLQKLATEDVPYLYWRVRASSTRKDSFQDLSLKEVTIESEYGKKTYKIPIFKLDHNIENDRSIRSIQSYILQKHPLIADSLNSNWTKSLQKMGFSGRNIVRVSVLDLLEQETKHYSNDSLVLNRADSLFSFYVGCRSEIEVTGFLDLPWWKTFFLKDIVLLCALLVICFLLPFIKKYINKLYRTYIIKTEIITIEKQVPVIATEKSKVHIYQLDTGVVFDYNTRELRKINKSEPLAPQLADLLKLFLEADDYMLTNIEIAKAFWPYTIDAKNNIYAAIKKLRINLSRISFCTVDNKNSAYQLKIPDYTKEKA